ncbi:MAG: A/G-specific adenine glycosylase, partial [Deltaproteobacteria bacterium]|nr:A/G-specific adenine glycosylase [Deltaproteobacteria bacterium]
QTQVDTVIPYFRSFLSCFPTVDALAQAPLDDVLKAWENLGYYARARNMHHAAKKIVRSFGGKIPKTREDLVRLPGIGDYTAGAILSIAFGVPCAAVDANIRRVICRLFVIRTPLDKSQTKKNIANIAGRLVPEKGPGAFNQGLMDLGAAICTPKKPRCQDCPVQKECQAFLQGIQEIVPVKRKRAPIPHYHVTAAVLGDKKGRLLLVQRPNEGLLGGLWKLPGGREKQKESLADCLKRTTYEELGIHIRVGREIAKVNHAYTHFRITLHAFTCTLKSGKLKALTCIGWRWSAMAESTDLAFSKADRKILEALQER